MNEKIPAGRDMWSAGLPIADVLRVLLDRTLETRPKKEVELHPFSPCRCLKFTGILGRMRLDLAEWYPDAAAGTGVICEFGISCTKTEDIYLNVSPESKVWFNGECVYDGIAGTVNTAETLARDGSEALRHIPITVTGSGENRVRMACEKRPGRPFALEFLLSVRRYPEMWANDYLFAARAVLLTPEYRDEDGVAISELLPPGGWNRSEISWCWPRPLPRSESFDFQHLCGAGDTAYVYTQALEDHTLSLCGTVERVLVNSRPAALRNGKLPLKRGDRVLLRCTKQREEWFLTLDTAKIGLPFLHSRRGRCDKAIWVGPFTGRQCFGPEYAWDFSTVFVNEQGERLYWGFCDGSELRLMLDSVFYGQWFYALMVGFYGIREAAAYLGDRDRQGLLRTSIDREGNVYGVCMGSGCAQEAEYYFTIPTTVNDDHGTGVLLAAGSEYAALCQKLGREPL